MIVNNIHVTVSMAFISITLLPEVIVGFTSSLGNKASIDAVLAGIACW